LMILSPSDGSTVSGVIRLYVNPGGVAYPSLVYLRAEVDGKTLPSMTKVNNPANSLATIEVDTAYLADGSHAFSVKGYSGFGDVGSPPQMFESTAVTLETANQTTYSEWIDRAQGKVNINLKASLPQYTLYFFDSSYPKAYDPFNQISSRNGTSAADGTISLSEGPASLGFASVSTGSAIYSVTEQNSGSPGGSPSQASANPAILEDPPFPDLGEWVTTYDDSTIDFLLTTQVPPKIIAVADHKDNQDSYWGHDCQLGCAPNPLWGDYGQVHNNFLDAGWAGCGDFASGGSSGTYLAPPPGADQPGYNSTNSTLGQTWPVRGAEKNKIPEGYHNDIQLLAGFASLPEVRNFYGSGHADACFMNFEAPLPQRYRFVFLDGCDSYHYAIFSFFGAVKGEVPAQNCLSEVNNLMDDCDCKSDELDFYASYGLRPAAFIGSALPVPIGRTLVMPEKFTSPLGALWTPYVIPEAIANWHEQFLSSWRGAPGSAPMGVLDAKQNADKLAWKDPSQGGWNGVAPAPPSQADLQVAEDPYGNPLYFSPVTCFKIAGYAWLTFNEYNHASDDLPQGD